MKRGLSPWWLVVALALHVLPFIHRGALIGGDEPHYALMAYSIGVDHDFNLDADYDRVAHGSNESGVKRAGKVLERHLRSVDDVEVFSHSVGLPLIAAPLLALQMKLMPGSAPDYTLILLTLSVTFAALVVGWRLLSGALGDSRVAAVVVMCTYFGSPLWFYSRTFFTEPYIWALAVLSVGAIARRRLLLAGLALGLALAVKETAVLVVAPILLVAAYRMGVRAAAIIGLGPAAWLGVFFWKNIALVGTPFSTFQAYEVGDPLQGAIGLLVDPTHGLLWFSPVLVVGAVGLLQEGRIARDIRVGALVSLVSYFAVTAGWVDWGGGSCYATRLLLPILPILGLGLANRLQESATLQRLIGPLFVLAFIPNWCAANNPFASFWGMPVSALIVENLVWASTGALVGTLIYVLVQRHFPPDLGHGWTEEAPRDQAVV